MTFRLRPHTDADLTAENQIHNLIAPEPVSEAEMRKQIAAHRATAATWERWIAEATDGATIGYGSVVRADDMPPGWWYIKIMIHPEHRKQGAGAALYTHLEAIAREGGAQEIESFVMGDDEEALAWAQSRGFRDDRLRTESILDLTTFDLTRFAGVVERTAATGIRFECHYPTQPESDEFLTRMYDLHAETFPDVPIFVPPFPPYETWVKQFRGEGKDGLPIYGVYAYDGDKIVGESTISLPDMPGAAAWTHYTAVRKSHRGRGLALALKLLTIEAALARGVKRMRTNNDPDNPAMLAVNEKLGYELVPAPRRIMKSIKPE